MIAQFLDLLIPHFFIKRPIPEQLPASMEKVVHTPQNIKDTTQRVRKAYDVLAAKYKGYSLRTYTRFFQMYETNVHNIWQRTDFIHCTTMNYLLRILLVKSSIPDKHIRLRNTLKWYISPHQYLQVQIGRAWLNVDLWGAHNNVPFGTYAHSFH